MSIVEKLIAAPEKFSIDELKQGVQHGVIPAYIGIPLIQDKLKQQQTQTQPAPKQPPIAAQVMQAADNDERQRAIADLRSNLPAEYAGGGIIAFADGGDTDDEDDDEDAMPMISRARLPEFAEFGTMVPLGIGSMVSRAAKQEQSVKVGDQPKVTHGEGIKTLTKEAFDPLLKHVIYKESRGNRYDKEGKLLTSSKGAQGEMQVMPSTLRNPGFGVEPARGRNPEEIARVGRDYLTALFQKYGDPKLAAIAYNWGPTNTDRWLSAGADFSKLPAETKQYITGLARGGQVQRFAHKGIVTQGAETINPELQSQIDILGPELDAARAELAKIQPVGSRGQMYGASTSGYLDAKKKVSDLEAQWDSLMQQAGMYKPVTQPIGGSSFGPPKTAVPPNPYMANMIQQGAGTATPVVPAGPAVSEQYPQEFQRGSAADIVRQQSAVNAISGYDPTQEDYDLGQAMSRNVFNQQKQAQAVEENKLDKFEELFKAREDQLKKEKEEDKWMAMLAAGLGMMGGTSPFAAANIGRGGQMGVQALIEANKQRSAEERALLQNRLHLDIEKEKNAIQKNRWQDWKEAHNDENQLKREIYERGTTTANVNYLLQVLGKTQAEIKTLRAKGMMITPKEKQQLDDLVEQEKNYFSQLSEYTGVPAPKSETTTSGQLQIDKSGKMKYGYNKVK